MNATKSTTAKETITAEQVQKLRVEAIKAKDALCDFFDSLDCLGGGSITDYVSFPCDDDFDIKKSYGLICETDCTMADLYDYLLDNGAFDQEIIYYNRAMDYLRKHDPSLRESIELALDYGYSIANLNSELLATILASQNNRDSFGEHWNEIESLLDEYTDALYEFSQAEWDYNHIEETA